MKPSIKKVFWHDMQPTVAKLNPELAEIISRIDPPYPLFKATFPFGVEFIKNGKLYLPNDQGEFVLLEDSSLSNELREELGYNVGTNPVSMVLNNLAELFLSIDETSLPFFLGFLSPGRLFSIHRVLSPQFSHQPAFLWNITAGARNLFMLPKISDISGFKRLRKKFHLHVDKPTNVAEHWALFAEIANHPSFKEFWHEKPWSMEILFFSKKWFASFQDKAWHEFHRYLLQTAWDGSEFWRNRFIWDLIFSYIHRSRNIRSSPYIADTAKHLLAISVGAIPGIAPTTDNAAGPITGLQQVFKDIYQLDNYLPIILQSKFFSLYQPCQPVYYSLQYPTTLEFSVKSSENTSALSDLYDVKSLMEKYFYNIRLGNLNIDHTPLADAPKLVQFSYYHSDNEGKYRDILPTNKIPLEDSTFAKIEGMKKAAFPLQSTFVRGCIRISHKE